MMLTEKDLWDYAVDRAIEIWSNRATILEDDRTCPFCSVHDLIDKTGWEECINDCVLKDCIMTPYGAYRELDIEAGDGDKMIKYAQEMVNMLQAYKNGDMDLFNKYLNYYDPKTQTVIFEE